MGKPRMHKQAGDEGPGPRYDQFPVVGKGQPVLRLFKDRLHRYPAVSHDQQNKAIKNVQEKEYTDVNEEEPGEGASTSYLKTYIIGDGTEHFS